MKLNKLVNEKAKNIDFGKRNSQNLSKGNRNIYKEFEKSIEN